MSKYFSSFKIIYGDEVFWTACSFLSRILRGPFTVFFVLRYLDSYSQGVYYSFLSLGALSIFAELGFSRLVSVFIGHEFSKIEFKDGLLYGPEEALNRIFSYCSFSLKTYSIIIIAALIVLVPSGIYLFRNETAFIHVCWILFAITNGLTLLTSYLQAIGLGLNDVAKVNKSIVFSGLVGTSALWISLAFNFDVMSLPIAFLITAIATLIYLWGEYKSLFLQWLHFKFTMENHWFKHSLSLQLRYAIGFIAGWVAFNFYTPAIFEFYGPVLAGKFGLTAMIVFLLVPVSSLVFNAFSPKVTLLIAKKKFYESRKLFLVCSSIGFIIFLMASLSVLGLLRVNAIFGWAPDRFLSAPETAMIMVSELATYFYGLMAVYTRLFKTEVFHRLSFVQLPVMLLLITVLLPKVDIFVFFISVAAFQWFIFLPLSAWLFFPFWRRVSKQDHAI